MVFIEIYTLRSVHIAIDPNRPDPLTSLTIGRDPLWAPTLPTLGPLGTRLEGTQGPGPPPQAPVFCFCFLALARPF